jgi:hypothetical protein
MPQRIKSIRVPSPHIQGNDSWTDIKPMTLDQFNRHIDIQRLAGTPRDPELSDEQSAVIAEQIGQSQRELFAEIVAGWNWVDDQDKPLPQPANSPDTFKLLTMAEFMFIGEAVNKGISIEKKDGKKLRK